MIQKIAKITLYVENQTSAKDFWINNLNFTVTFEQPMGQNMTWLEVSPKDNSETSFVLYEKEWMQKQNPNTDTAHPSVILSTDNIKKIYDDLKSKNVKVTDIMNFPYGSMFTFYDQDNNSFLIREDK